MARLQQRLYRCKQYVVTLPRLQQTNGRNDEPIIGNLERLFAAGASRHLLAEVHDTDPGRRNPVELCQCVGCALGTCDPEIRALRHASIDCILHDNWGSRAVRDVVHEVDNSADAAAAGYDGREPTAFGSRVAAVVHMQDIGFQATE